MADEKMVSRVLLIGLAVVVLAILIAQYMSFKKSGDGAKGTSSGAWSKETFAMGGPAPTPTFQEASATASPAGTVMPSEPLNNEMYKAVNFETSQKLPSDCVPRDKLTVEDLLPKDAANSKWAQVAPAGQGDVTGQNFLTAGHLVGVNTVGQTMRNANYQLRSDPPIDRVNVGPWNQTTIEYDNSRRFFEIGAC